MTRRLALGMAVLAAIAAACSEGGDELPPRTTVEMQDDASADGASPASDASAPSDAGSDARVDAAVDAGPSGARFVATGAGPHPTIGYGDHSCAIAGLERSVYCWGANDHGQIGNGVATDAGATADAGVAADVLTPVKLATDETGQPFDGADELSLAAWHSCARKGDALACWGQRYSGAQAEPPAANNADRTKPRVMAVLQITTLAAGGPHTCALQKSGKVTCFGHSYFNELGRSRAMDPTCDAPIFYDYPMFMNAHTCSGDTAPLDMTLNAVDAIAAGEVHSCALVNGSISCWGSNTNGQLGNPNGGFAELNPLTVYTDVAGTTALTGASRIAAGGGKHTCALAGGKVLCWGDNAVGQLGLDPAQVTQQPFASEVPGITGAIGIGVGDGVSCAILADHSVKCWGADDAGQLGDGTPKASSFTPVAVTGLTNVTQIAPGRRHVCALKGDATVWCWGKNDRGQLGTGTRTDSLAPVKVATLPP